MSIVVVIRVVVVFDILVVVDCCFVAFSVASRRVNIHPKLICRYKQCNLGMIARANSSLDENC